VPLFEYSCNKCENVYKIWKHRKPKPENCLCNECGGEGTQILNIAYVNFKGTGFYETDYKNNEIALPAEDE
jgi:putative FmdB family regulatory protein